MATWQKFNATPANLGNGIYNLNSDTLKIMLTDTLPVATNAVYSDITEITNGNGYSTGGVSVGSTAYSQTSGTATLTGASVVFTASGGSIAQFRYAVLYDFTPVSKNLLLWIDYGSELVLASGSALTITVPSGFFTLA